MQLLLTVLAVLVAIIGGVFTMAVAAVTVLVVFLSRRLLGKPRAAIASNPRRRAASMSRPGAGDVIEVSATEVREPRRELR